MLFPVSGVEVNPFVPFIAAFIVSFFTSMGGVSGAFLLLPFQVSILGYTAPSVSATNQVFNIVAIPSGVYRYIREGRMLWPLTWAVIIGTLPGVFIGAWIRIEYLPNPKNFKFFVGFVLLYIGWRLLLDVARPKNKYEDKGSPAGSVSSHFVDVKMSTMKKVEFEYDGETFEFSSPIIYALCFLVGIAGGIYGIGGGSIIAPFFVAIIGLPVYTVAGAALMGTFITSVAGVTFYQFLSQFYPDVSVAPDWSLGFLFGIGGFLGMYLGARTQKFVPAKYIKGMLCVCVLFVAGKYLLGFLM
ncbi:MAG: sulfite exporter TauE/SafE family protein [Desulfobacterales bacterium]|uniref:Probable membrane transporter protein n=1 Tax=Candidatus Desulfatibia vada TaxID=2841696 RepID=A0A8J6NYR9_9BACT|nr:sulfite exporter TauE/SafE family protein [Candidatus Desulfatibia vada]